MALIDCPDCGTAVSDMASACPVCARPYPGLAAQEALELEAIRLADLNDLPDDMDDETPQDDAAVVDEQDAHPQDEEGDEDDDEGPIGPGPDDRLTRFSKVVHPRRPRPKAAPLPEVAPVTLQEPAPRPQHTPPPDPAPAPPQPAPAPAAPPPAPAPAAPAPPPPPAAPPAPVEAVKDTSDSDAYWAGFFIAWIIYLVKYGFWEALFPGLLVALLSWIYVIYAIIVAIF